MLEDDIEYTRKNLPVTKNKDLFSGVIKFPDGSHNITLEFDRIYKYRMRELLNFIKKISKQQMKYDINNKNIEKYKDTKYSFLGTSALVASQLLYILMKDELSEQTSNFALDYLCKYLSRNDETLEVNQIEYRFYSEIMININNCNFNAILIGQLDDLFISIWSCFEASINSLTKSFETNIINELELSSLKKFKNLVKDIFKENINDEILLKTKNLKEKFIKKYPVYISITDRTNYLYKYELNNYTRDRNNDKDTLLFAGAIRNTIHNNGIHTKNDKELDLMGIHFSLKKNKRFYLDNFNDIMTLINGECLSKYSQSNVLKNMKEILICKSLPKL